MTDSGAEQSKYELYTKKLIRPNVNVITTI